MKDPLPEAYGVVYRRGFYASYSTSAKALTSAHRPTRHARKPVVRRAARDGFCTDPVAYLHTHVYPAR